MAIAGIILCGGASRRMGQEKALLPFGPETMVERVARILEAEVDEVILVGRPGQELPGAHRMVHDDVLGEGPLAGLVFGLAAVRSERAFVASCDTPLLSGAVVRRLLQLSSGNDVAVPLTPDGRIVPLTAVYDRSVLALARRLFDSGERRMTEVARRSRTLFVRPGELHDVDPELESILSVNTPEVYHEALRRAGFADQEPGSRKPEG